MNKENPEFEKVCANLPINEIIDPQKRQEFQNEFDRLIDRCGLDVMAVTLDLYMYEQQIQDDKSLPKIDILVNKNTAKIISRLSEDGIANCYLSNEPVSPETVVFNKDHNPSLIRSYASGVIKTKAKIEGLPKLLTLSLKRNKPLWENATLIPPDEIKNVFSNIDAQH